MTVIYRYVPADLDNMKFNKWAWQLKSRKEIRKFKKYLELAQAFTLYDEAKDKPVAVLAFHEYGEGMYYACIIASEDFGKNPKYAAKIPNCAAAPNKKLLGLAIRGPKSVMAPTPRKIRDGRIAHSSSL